MKFLIKVILASCLIITFVSINCFALINKTAALTETYQFTYVPNQWLIMSDGVKLSVSYWLPKAKTANEKFPVVFEMLPYRKDDTFYLVDYPIQAYLAKHGIAGVRVDMRGTGSSEGVVPDREYSEQELADISTVMEQLAVKPWSNGNIGMQGKSWGAFNAMMMAMKQPKHLRGILVAHGSEDLYANDIHNIDGVLHLDIFTIEIDVDNLLPASPDYIVNEKYYTNRFDQKPWIFTYLKHQQDGKFWQQHSLQSNYASINIPVFAFASLLDGYRDFAINMLDHIKSPIRVMIGPQNHAWPDGYPGPNYEWRQMAVRWWLQILNHQEQGVWNDPKLIVFMRDSVSAKLNLKKTPGSYWSEKWPILDSHFLTFFPQQNHLLTNQITHSAMHSLMYQPSAGQGVLNWWGETTPDMRIADKGTLVYDSLPLQQEIYVMGKPQVTLQVSANAPLADWIARLEDVNPDGSVSFVTGGLINGAQRESRSVPKSIIIDKKFQIHFPMHFTTWTFAKGHKIRFIVSNSQFPMVWPTPYKMITTLTVGDGSSELKLPVVTSNQYLTPKLPVIESSELPTDARSIKEINLTPFTITHDSNGNTIAFSKEAYSMLIRGNVLTYNYKTIYQVNDNNPAQATFIGTGVDSVYIPRKRKKITVTSTIRIISDEKYFHTTVVHKILINTKLLRIRVWKEDIPRYFQ